MTKKESLEFLDSCLNDIKTMSADDLSKIDEAYGKEIQNIYEGLIEFVPPSLVK